METLKYLVNKYGVDLNEKIVKLKFSRWKEYPLLLKELGFNKGVEMGVYKGQFSETLCKANPKLSLSCVDAWTVYKGYRDYSIPDLERTAYEEAKKRLEPYNCQIIRKWSLEAVELFKDESLDFVFIDGNHDFRHVVEDVDSWSRKVKKGGIVSGHDFFPNHRKNFGVFEAIPAWCEAYDIKPLFVWTNDKCPSWFYVKV